MVEQVRADTASLPIHLRVRVTHEDDIRRKAFCRLDGIITLVDAKHVLRHLDEQKEDGAINEAVEQVASRSPEPEP